jgi:Bacterial protein of unknown function (DUF937)
MASLLDMLSQQLSPEVVRGMGKQIGADEKQTEQALSALLPMMVGGLAKNTTGNPQGAMKLSQALERDHDGSMLDHITGMLGGQSAKNHPLAGMLGGGQQGGGDLLSALLGGLGGGQQQSGQQGGMGSLLGGLLGSGGAGELLGGLMGGGSQQRQQSGGAADLLGTLLGGGGGGMANVLGGLLGTAPASSRTGNIAGILGNILGAGNVGQIQQGVSKASGLDANKIGALMAMLAPLVMGALGKVKRQQGLDAGGLARVLENDRQTIEQRVPEASNISVFLDSNRDGKVDMKDDIAKVGMALGGAMLLSQMRKK